VHDCQNIEENFTLAVRNILKIAPSHSTARQRGEVLKISTPTLDNLKKLRRARVGRLNEVTHRARSEQRMTSWHVIMNLYYE